MRQASNDCFKEQNERISWRFCKNDLVDLRDKTTYIVGGGFAILVPGWIIQLNAQRFSLASPSVLAC